MPNNTQVIFRPEDAFSTEDTGQDCQICWIVPNAQKNVMEPIILRLQPKGRTAEYGPHPGDVLGFVLSGRITLNINGERWKLKKGECFYHTASSSYYLENHQGSPAEVFWVTSPPNF